MKEIKFEDKISEARDLMISNFRINGIAYNAVSHLFFKNEENQKCTAPKLFIIDIYSILEDGEENSANSLRKVYHFQYDSDLTKIAGGQEINPIEFFQDINEISYSIEQFTHNSIYMFVNNELNLNKFTKKWVCAIHRNYNEYGNRISTYSGELYVEFDKEKHNGVVIMPNGLQVDIKVEPECPGSDLPVRYSNYCNNTVYFISDYSQKVFDDAISFLNRDLQYNKKEISMLEYCNRNITEELDKLVVNKNLN